MAPLVHLNKCIYGLKQAAYEWRRHLHQSLLSLGFIQNRSDACVYRKDDGGDYLIIATHVDDVICASSSLKLTSWLYTAIKNIYVITTADPLTEFIGMSIHRNVNDNTITLTQPGYIQVLTNKF
jgi:hypothetical protein